MTTQYSTHTERHVVPGGDDRRAMPRIANGSEVMLREVDATTDCNMATGYTRNLSTGGACLYTRQRLVPGQQVQVTILIESDRGSAGLPSQFDGVATVLRANPIDARFMAVALRFDFALAGDAAYAAYVARLGTTH
jgi:hypothetical protein